jgi:Zn-dependent protease with chaperone function
MRPRFFALLSILILLSAAAFGQRGARNPRTEQDIANGLASVAPTAVETFQDATTALDKEDYEQAISLYREVLQQAPRFTPAMRRLGASLAASGQIEEGLTYSERAVKIERSPENLASLAQVLARPSQTQQGTEEQKQRALQLAQEASNRYTGPDDLSYLSLVAGLALELQRNGEFRQAEQTVMQRHPDTVNAHYFHAIELAMNEDWIAAEDEIKKAERLGLPPQAAETFLASGVHTRALAWRSGYFALYATVAWACGFFVLFAAGKLLSKLTLRLVARVDLGSSASGTAVFLRRVYRQLINIAGAYYYISIPFVIVLVLGLSGGIIYAFLWIGQIPIKLVAILGIGAIVTVYKLVHSLFVRISHDEPGRRLRREEAPDFWNLTREVAGHLGTRPLDEIRITPGTEMAVYERGSFNQRRKDAARRTLVMGLGLLPGFEQNSFRAVLAHEYGHLAHRDTAGGDVALRVNQDMMKFAYAMAAAGQAVPWNIGFQFLRLYSFLFRRISHGATRLQEVLADRAAARLYGSQVFEDGLCHVVRRQVEFKYVAGKELQEALKAGRPMQNIYALEAQPDKTLENAIDKALYRQTSEDDTHPSPADRFRLVSRVPCANQPAPSGLVLDLFKDSEAITREMTTQAEYEIRASAALRRQALQPKK